MLRRIVGAFLILMLLEGALRKWALPQYSNQIFVLKDVLLFLACLAYVPQREKNAPSVLEFGVWFSWIMLVTVYAVVEGSAVGFIGLRYYLAPVPLVFLVPALIRGPEDLERLATWGTRIALPIGILAVVQYFSPMDSPINIYARGDEEAVGGFGSEGEATYVLGRPRVTATFSYIGTFAAFLAAAWVLAWISALEGRKRGDRRFAALVLVLIAFNMAMNGSRALFIAAAITGLPFAFLAIRRLGAIRLQLLAIAVGVGVFSAGVAIFEPFALTAMRGGPEEAAERILAALMLPINVLTSVDALGAGMGSTFGGTEDLGLRSTGVAFDDINLDRVGLELGVFGYLGYLLLKVFLLVKAFRVWRRTRDEMLRHWAAAALLVQISNGWQIPFYNSVAAIIYFASVGLVYWLERRLRTNPPQRAQPAPAYWVPAHRPMPRER